MPKLRSVLVCACLVACPGGPAFAEDKCHYVSSWQVSRRHTEAHLVSGTREPADYVIVARKGGVTVTFDSTGDKAGPGSTAKSVSLSAPNSLVLRQAKEVRVEQSGRIPSHGILQVCKW